MGLTIRYPYRICVSVISVITSTSNKLQLNYDKTRIHTEINNGTEQGNFFRVVFS